MQVVGTGLPYLIVPVHSGLDSVAIRHRDFEGLLAQSEAKFVFVLDSERPEGRTWDNAGRGQPGHRAGAGHRGPQHRRETAAHGSVDGESFTG
jgi:hypothetical protein